MNEPFSWGSLRNFQLKFCFHGQEGGWLPHFLFCLLGSLSQIRGCGFISEEVRTA